MLILNPLTGKMFEVRVLRPSECASSQDPRAAGLMQSGRIRL
jgi:hypothetical protein